MTEEPEAVFTADVANDRLVRMPCVSSSSFLVVWADVIAFCEFGHPSREVGRRREERYYRKGPHRAISRLLFYLIGSVRMVEVKSIEVFSEASNTAIVRMPGRKFPGMVIQGDTFSNLVSLAEQIRRKATDGPLQDDADHLLRLLSDRLAHYEQVLSENGIELPYVRAEGKQ
jgi:hypothetical protein